MQHTSNKGEVTVMNFNTMYIFEVYMIRETEKAVCLKCAKTGKVSWFPRSWFIGKEYNRGGAVARWANGLFFDKGFHHSEEFRG